MTDVRIGIVAWNTAELLDRCLRALPAAIAPLTAEVVVVDNASSDASVDVVAAHPDVVLIRNDENLGYAKAMNQALAGTRAPVLIALNPDTEPSPGALAQLVARLHESPHAALVAPRLVNPDGSVQHSVYRFPAPRVTLAACLPSFVQRGPLGDRFWLVGHAGHDRSGEVDWAVGAVHCIRACAVDGTTPYRERWFMYVEDLDLCWRLRRAGWQVCFASDIDVIHIGNASGNQAWGADRTARWLDATYDWYATEHGRLAARFLAAVSVVGLVLRLAFTAARRRSTDEVRQWLRMHGRKLVFGPRSTAPSTRRVAGPVMSRP